MHNRRDNQRTSIYSASFSFFSFSISFIEPLKKHKIYTHQTSLSPFKTHFSRIIMYNILLFWSFINSPHWQRLWLHLFECFCFFFFSQVSTYGVFMKDFNNVSTNILNKCSIACTQQNIPQNVVKWLIQCRWHLYYDYH